MRKISIEQKRANHNRYQREYRRKNRDKVRKWNIAYYMKKAMQYAEQEK